MIRVIVADDHELMREGIKKILSQERDMRVVGEAADIEELLGSAATRNADIVILDLEFPGRSGLDAIVELRQAHRGLAVVVLSAYAEDRFAVRALKAGAAAYVHKASATAELVKAIRRVANGERYFSSLVVDLVARELQNPNGDAPHLRLSARETQILSMIGAGKPTKQIASELSIAVKTVGVHRTRILKKMGMHSGAELVRYAIKHGLAE